MLLFNAIERGIEDESTVGDLPHKVIAGYWLVYSSKQTKEKFSKKLKVSSYVIQILLIWNIYKA